MNNLPEDVWGEILTLNFDRLDSFNIDSSSRSFTEHSVVNSVWGYLSDFFVLSYRFCER